MAEDTKIGWTDHTFNGWTGCTKVSPGCEHCYAEGWAKRSGVVQWGPGAARRHTSAKNWTEPYKWNDRHAAFFVLHGRRQRVFSASLSDWLDNEAPAAWLLDLLKLVHATPNLDWLLLTKRIGNFQARLVEAALELEHAYAPDSFAPWLHSWLGGTPPVNVWVGATIVTREEMLRDGPKLASVPARVRFWSCEPLLEDLGRVPAMLLPHWIIAGGESGPKCRPCDVEWLYSLRNEAVAGAVPLFVKQLGGHPDKRDRLEDLPTWLRIRQWPAS